MEHYLDSYIEEMKPNAVINIRGNYTKVYGKFGMATIWKEASAFNVYFFDENQEKSDEMFRTRLKKQALVWALEWATKGSI